MLLQAGTPNLSQQSLLQEGLKKHQSGELSAAIDCYHQALKIAPSAEAYANLGVALRMQGHLEAAVIAYRKALALDRTHVGTLSNLGGAYRALGQLDEALPLLTKAIQLQPDFAAAHYNLGLVYMDSGEPEKAIACFETTLQLEPDRVDAPFDRATCLLQSGNLRQGFAAYECRFAYEKRLVKPYAQPKWDGSPLKNQTLLLYAEQGFGDTLQFCRYIPFIEKQAGSRIILECPAPLKRIMQTVSWLDEVLVPGDPLPPFDVHASLLSLPHLFQTDLFSIPAQVPYLFSPKPEFHFKPNPVNQLKVGIVWASGHTDVGMRNRTIALSNWQSLLELPHIQFYSLQKGPQLKELEALGLNLLIEDLSPQIQDFADTAAILNELDILISADTAIVHLAGALNKPVWVLLPYGSEWRWLLERPDSPWYPSVRLFRQVENETWEKLLSGDVCQALKHWDDY